MTGFEVLKSEEPKLYRDVLRLARVLSDNFDVTGENMCTDVTHVASELLRAKGYDAKHVGVDGESHHLPTDVGHAWVRVRDWNIDFTLGQFEGLETLPYPFVTKRDSPDALTLYGRGSEKVGGVDVLSPEEAKAGGYPLLRDLRKAQQEGAMCDLDDYRAAADQFLR